jgi:hypothetical protein
LKIERGIVSSRVALLLRSAEIKPSFLVILKRKNDFLMMKEAMIRAFVKKGLKKSSLSQGQKSFFFFVFSKLKTGDELIIPTLTFEKISKLLPLSENSVKLDFSL